MAISVIIGVFVGLVVGCASMAMWVVRRIGGKAARQFDRGFERGHLTATCRLDPVGRTRRTLIVPGEPPGGATLEADDPPPLPLSQWHRAAEPRTYARPPLRPGPRLA